MLIAKDKNDERVEANDAERFCDKGKYFCQKCGNPVFPKKGNIKIDHFAHYPSEESCEFFEPETERHKKGKSILENKFKELEWVNEVVKEKPLDGCIPDVIVYYDGGKIGVEFQHSPMPYNEMIERTKTIEENNTIPVWVFDYNTFKNRQIETLTNFPIFLRDDKLITNSGKVDLKYPFIKEDKYSKTIIFNKVTNICEDCVEKKLNNYIGNKINVRSVKKCDYCGEKCGICDLCSITQGRKFGELFLCKKHYNRLSWLKNAIHKEEKTFYEKIIRLEGNRILNKLDKIKNKEEITNIKLKLGEVFCDIYELKNTSLDKLIILKNPKFELSRYSISPMANLKVYKEESLRIFGKVSEYIFNGEKREFEKEKWGKIGITGRGDVNSSLLSYFLNNKIESSKVGISEIKWTNQIGNKIFDSSIKKKKLLDGEFIIFNYFEGYDKSYENNYIKIFIKYGGEWRFWDTYGKVIKKQMEKFDLPLKVKLREINSKNEYSYLKLIPTKEENQQMTKKIKIFE